VASDTERMQEAIPREQDIKHFAFFCGDPDTETFDIVIVHAEDGREAWHDAADEMFERGWPDDQKIIFLGFAV
jgi:hypothetical protein